MPKQTAPVMILAVDVDPATGAILGVLLVPPLVAAVADR